MTTVYDVKAEPLIHEVADNLQEEFDAPEWTKYVKSGSNRDNPPEQEDWYHIRSSGQSTEAEKTTATDLNTMEKHQEK